MPKTVQYQIFGPNTKRERWSKVSLIDEHHTSYKIYRTGHVETPNIPSNNTCNHCALLKVVQYYITVSFDSVQ